MANEFASFGEVVVSDLPTKSTSGKIYDKLIVEKEGVAYPATETERTLKSKYLTESFRVEDKGFTICVELQPQTTYDSINGDSTAITYVKFTVGEKPTFSTYFGDKAPSYEFYNHPVAAIKIDIAKNIIQIDFVPPSATNRLIIDKGKISWGIASEDGAKGIVIQKPNATTQPCMVYVAPLTQESIDEFKNGWDNFADFDALAPLAGGIKALNKVGRGVYIYEITAKVYLTTQSFTFDNDVDTKYLIAPKVSYKGKPKLGKNNYVRFDCLIEQKSLRTNNYTGFDKDDPHTYSVTLQFPGDEAKLAPQGTKKGETVNCGENAKEHTNLTAVTPHYNGTIVKQVRLDFADGSHYTFPDSETGLFTAIDKDDNGELQGLVKNLIVADGDWKEAYAKEVANRIVRNINDSMSIEEGGKYLTSALAWKSEGTVKIIVPTKGGSKLITIPKRGA